MRDNRKNMLHQKYSPYFLRTFELLTSILFVMACLFSLTTFQSARAVVPLSSLSSQKPIDTIDTALWRGEFDLRNANLPTQWWLKQYFQEPNQKGSLMHMLSDHSISLAVEPYKGAVAFKESIKTDSTPMSAFMTQVGGLKIIRSVSWPANHYRLHLLLDIKNESSVDRLVHPSLRIQLPQRNQSNTSFYQPDTHQLFPSYRMGEEIVRVKNFKNKDPAQIHVGAIPWAALEDRYFIYAIYPEYPQYDDHQIYYGYQGEEVFIELRQKPTWIRPGETEFYAFHLYLGPKDSDYLYRGEADLTDVPVFNVIVSKTVEFFKKLHRYIKNWGLILFLLAVVFQLVLYPLTRKAKYTTLPLLLQIPVYLLLYQIVYYAVDFRFAPFLFYQDLSAPDPYYILPIICAGLLLLHYYFSPKPSSKRKRTALPLFFLALAIVPIFLPLGLVLYYATCLLMTLLLPKKSVDNSKVEEQPRETDTVMEAIS